MKLQTISIRDLPRITDKSAMFMGKFLSQLTCLDISGTSQVTGGVLNEVAQHSLVRSAVLRGRSARCAMLGTDGSSGATRKSKR